MARNDNAPFFVHRLGPCVKSWEVAMRGTRFLITASIFSSIFIALALMAVVFTDTFQAKLNARPAMTVLIQN